MPTEAVHGVGDCVLVRTRDVGEWRKALRHLSPALYGSQFPRRQDLGGGEQITPVGPRCRADPDQLPIDPAAQAAQLAGQGAKTGVVEAIDGNVAPS